MNFLKKHLFEIGAGAILLAVCVSITPKAMAVNNPILPQTDSRRNAEYRDVFNQDGVAHSSGTVMIYVNATTATFAGLSVSTVTASASAQVAGVVPAGMTLPASGWGKIQVYGYHPGINIAPTTAVTAGDALVTSTTSGAAFSLTQVISTTTASSNFGVFATPLDTVTSSASVRGFIRAN